MRIAIDTNIARDHLENRAGYTEAYFLVQLHWQRRIQLWMSPATLLRDVPCEPLLPQLLEWATRHKIQQLKDWPVYSEGVRGSLDEGLFIPFALNPEGIVVTTATLDWNKPNYVVRHGQSFDVIDAAGRVVEIQHKDNKDWDLVEAAHVGLCDALVTNDCRMLREAPEKGTLWVVQPQEFIRVAQEQETCHVRKCAVCKTPIMSFVLPPHMHGYCQVLHYAMKATRRFNPSR